MSFSKPWKTGRGFLPIIGTFAFAMTAPAQTTRYVVPENPDAAVPYTNWVTAATNIQDAVDACAPGDTVLVTNGVYESGGRAAAGSSLTNRVCVDKAIRVASVNGPDETIISGVRTNGLSAVRGVYLTNGAALYGFTITNGATRTSGDYFLNMCGGGVWCEAGEDVVVSNCIVSGNTAGGSGGGLYRGWVVSSLVAGNSAQSGAGGYASTMLGCTVTVNTASSQGAGLCYGAGIRCVISSNWAGSAAGGAYYSALTNCVLEANRAATYGGGSYESTAFNCIYKNNIANYGGGNQWGTLHNCLLMDNTAYIQGGGALGAVIVNGILLDNEAPQGSNYHSCNISFSCATPRPEGAGNLDADPGLVCRFNPRLLPGSPCINAGTNENWMVGATDLAGRGRISNGLVDMGPYESYATALTGTIAVAILPEWTNAAAGFPIQFEADIQGDVQGYTWDWGDGQSTANVYRVVHAFADAGDFDVVLTASNLDTSVAATVTVTVVENPVYYVAPGGRHEPPFMDWTNAARDIQSAVDIAVPGSLVVVSNGVYDTGGITNYPALSTLTNRLAVHRPVTVQSVNGPGETQIVGNRDAATNGPSAVRCVYLGKGAALIGFTLANGATLAAGDIARNQSGGGLWCESSALPVSNCVLIGNSARVNGGGAYAGVFQNCTFSGNVSSNGAGAYRAVLADCLLARNTAHREGGGAYQGMLSGCMVTNNASGLYGGGVSQATLSNCVLVGNSAASQGGGAYNSDLVDCTISSNRVNLSGSSGGGTSGGTASNCLYRDNRCVGNGGGANGGTLWNCTFSNNTANGNGGGAHQAMLADCRLAGNTANSGGGAYGCTMERCQIVSNTAGRYGGGAGGGTGRVCTVTGNWAGSEGGGAYQGTWYRCTFTGNTAKNGGGHSRGLYYNCFLSGNTAESGGGSYMGALENCTIVDNSAWSAGGADHSKLTNSIVYYNRAMLNSNYLGGSWVACCTAPLIETGDCISEEPRLVSLNNPRLLPGSPCINVGTNAPWMEAETDWAGRPRLRDGTVDLGACEYDAGGFTGVLAVAFQANWTNVNMGFPVTFTAEVQGDAQGITWTWGDGESVTNMAVASHVFSQTGSYSVVLRATNQTSSAAATVTVHVVDSTIYVSPSGGHTAPFASWANAATTIQDAVDTALPGSLILVTNGLYNTGGRTNYPAGTTLSNRLAVHTPVMIRSVNGPEATIIQGALDPKTNGPAAVRCVYMVEQATLIGFTLTGGAVTTNGDTRMAQSGGGAWCEGPSAVLSNCVITANRSFYLAAGVLGGRCVDCTISSNVMDHVYLNNGGGAVGAILERCVIEDNGAMYGGGVYQSTLHNCRLFRNRSTRNADGGGAYDSTLYSCVLARNSAKCGGASFNSKLMNCTVVDNIASDSGGGCLGGSLLNCIVYYNTAMLLPNYDVLEISNCCLTPLSMGTGSTDEEPLLASLQEPRLLSLSPCVDRGTYYAWMDSATDMDGRPRILNDVPDLGAYETTVGAPTGALEVACSIDTATVAVGFQLTARADARGNVQGLRWTWGDGAFTHDSVMPSHAYAATGTYNIVLLASNATGSAAATAVVQVVTQPVHYVAPSGGHVPPYASWANAATTIQAAVNAATVAGALVLVNDGLYDTGTDSSAGGMPARVCVNKPLTVKSVNGPAATTIRGRGPVGSSAIRGVYLADGAVLSGFTVVSGCTYTASSGGGILCGADNVVVSNCIITACAAATDAGGLYRGTVFNSVLIGNTAAIHGGGAYGATIHDSQLCGNTASYGGGASQSTLFRCALTGNIATTFGGAADSCTLWNSVVTDNKANDLAGGVFRCSLYNCSIAHNWAKNGSGGADECEMENCTVAGNVAELGPGGGVNDCHLTNCIVFFNKALKFPNHHLSFFSHSCTDPLPPGAGNLNTAPLILCYRNPRLLPGSPCIDQGRVSSWMSGATDLAGRNRLNGAAPDLGTYEYHAGSQTGALAVGIWACWTNIAVGWSVPFRAEIEGDASGLVWNWGDGSYSTNEPGPSHAFPTAGVFNVVLSATNLSGSAAATATVQVVAQPVHYVSLSGANVSPFTNWLNAAKTIQAAVDAVTVPGALVLVTNGIYQTGARNGYPAGMVLKARVNINKPAIVASVNGPAATIIRGQGPVGDSAVRGVVVGPEARLEGFTVTEGATLQLWYSETEASGGGLWCYGGDAVVSNCVIANNRANALAAAAYLGTFYNCAFLSNIVVAGDAVVYRATLRDCVLMGGQATAGGGTYDSVQDRCLFYKNFSFRGGAVYGGEARNCLMYGNGDSQHKQGGASYNANLISCTLVGNMSANGGGAYRGSLVNCIVYGNFARDGVTSNIAEIAATSITYSCTSPDPGGVGNVDADPRFYKPGSGFGGGYVPGILHLRPESPCINAGTNQAWMAGATDFEGLARILDGRVDMGALESTPYGYDRDGDGMADWWEMEYFDSFTLAQPGDDPDGDLLLNLDEYNRRTSPVLADTDGDGMGDGAEVLAGTDPLSHLSFLGLTEIVYSAGTTGVVVRWQSVDGKRYTLSRSTNLVAGFDHAVKTNILGTAPLNTETDNTATNSSPYVYRISLEP